MPIPALVKSSPIFSSMGRLMPVPSAWVIITLFLPKAVKA